MNNANKLDCYITFNSKGMTGTNTLNLLVLCVSYEKMKCCEYDPWVHIHTRHITIFLWLSLW